MGTSHFLLLKSGNASMTTDNIRKLIVMKEWSSLAWPDPISSRGIIAAGRLY